MSDIQENGTAAEATSTPSSQSDPTEENVYATHLARLDRSAFDVLHASLEEKLQVVHKDKFILHPDAKMVLDRLEDVLNRPRVGRPTCHALVGPAGSGKSSVVKKFLNDHKRKSEAGEANVDSDQVLVVELPERCTAPNLGLAIHRCIRLSENPSRRARLVTDFVLRSLRTSQARMIFLNEFDHVGTVGSLERSVVLHSIKTLTNLGISVVAVGSQKTLDWIAEDGQVEDRLRPLRMSPLRSGKPFQQFLSTLETYYPLAEPSFLFRDHHKWIYEKTDGRLSRTVELINEAAAWALKNGRASIGKDALKAGLLVRG